MSILNPSFIFTLGCAYGPTKLHNLFIRLYLVVQPYGSQVANESHIRKHTDGFYPEEHANL